MPGRPDFSQPGTAGGGQTVAVTSRPEIVTQTYQKTAALAVDATEVIEVYAPTGSVYNVQMLDLEAQPDANWTGGAHQFNVKSAGLVSAVTGKSNYTTRVLFRNGHWVDADSLKRPTNEAAAGRLMQSVQATENTPFTLQYRNGADAQQDEPRDYNLTIEEVSY